MRTISVDPNFCDIHGYDSAVEAISAEAHTLRAKRSAADSSRIAGHYVRHYTVSDQAISVTLSNHLVLDIGVLDTQVEWQIIEADAVAADVVQQHYPPVRLLWPSGAETVLDPGALLKVRLPFPLQKLFAGECFVNAYFKGGGALQFLPLWNHSDQSPLLNVSELEPLKIVKMDGPPQDE